MYTLTLYDTKRKQEFKVTFTSPYLMDKWKKKHRIPYSKKLLLLAESKEY